MFGSSPLVRGQLPPHSLPGGRSRIIPARAGPTRPRRDSHNHRKDHPRSCGANRISRHAISCYSGSSPLVRGQRIWPLCFAAASRIIPARAGPTTIFLSLISIPSDHPRSCGANVRPPIRLVSLCGSSPLVRGQRWRARSCCRFVRIIPARAGPTGTGPRKPETTSDHPRSCGANIPFSRGGSPISGSSPLVRGQRALCGKPIDLTRIIPARAGPTPVAEPVPRRLSDHPRSCGANVDARRLLTGWNGSSPLVRGQHPRFQVPPAEVRIIPARAGPTRRWLSLRGSESDHPRSCGANSLILRGKSGLSQIKIFDYSSGIWQ